MKIIGIYPDTGKRNDNTIELECEKCKYVDSVIAQDVKKFNNGDTIELECKKCENGK